MGCNCSSVTTNCCPDKQFVQDKVCTPWSGEVPEDEEDPVPVTLFANNINQNIYVSGYLKYDSGPGTVTLQAVDGAGNVVGSAIQLTPGSSASFTFRRFNEIQALLPGGAANEGLYAGECCFTVRYPIS